MPGIRCALAVLLAAMALPASAQSLPGKPIERSTVLRPLGPVPKPRETLTPEQAKAFKRASAAAGHAAKVARCKAVDGAWNMEMRISQMYAYGSDVDEIYGRVSVSTPSGGTFIPSRRGAGWSRNDLWYSDSNVDLRTRQTGFYKLRILNLSGRRQDFANFYIHLDLHDEDDARGGSNDEKFIAIGPAGYLSGPNNSVVHRVLVPSCEEAPEFRHDRSFWVYGRSPDRLDDDKIYINIAARLYRSDPGSRP